MLVAAGSPAAFYLLDKCLTKAFTVALSASGRLLYFVIKSNSSSVGISVQQKNSAKVIPKALQNNPSVGMLGLDFLANIFAIVDCVTPDSSASL